MRRMFTVEQRDELMERLLLLGREDPVVVAGAIVGSVATGTADEFSDLDLAFGVADHVSVESVLDRWTTALIDMWEAVPLVDLARATTLYRIFLLRNALQLDLSMTPASEFRPSGPRFRLVFGKTALDISAENRRAVSLFIDTPAVAADVYGWGVIYGLHARACIERGRLWQAEHYLGAVRDHALSLACLRVGATAVQARGYDDLPIDVRRRLEPALVGALEPTRLQRALAVAVEALLVEGEEAHLPTAALVADRLSHLTRHDHVASRPASNHDE